MRGERKSSSYRAREGLNAAKNILDASDLEFVDKIVEEYMGRVDAAAPALKEKMGDLWNMFLTNERAGLRGSAVYALIARALCEGMKELGFVPAGEMRIFPADASWENFPQHLYFELEEDFLPEPPMTFYEAEIYFSVKERALSFEESDRLSEAVGELKNEMVKRIFEEGPRRAVVA